MCFFRRVHISPAIELITFRICTYTRQKSTSNSADDEMVKALVRVQKGGLGRVVRKVQIWPCPQAPLPESPPPQVRLPRPISYIFEYLRTTTIIPWKVHVNEDLREAIEYRPRLRHCEKQAGCLPRARHPAPSSQRGRRRANIPQTLPLPAKMFPCRLFECFGAPPVEEMMR